MHRICIKNEMLRYKSSKHEQGLYEQYMGLTRETKEYLNKWRDTLPMDWKYHHIKTSFLSKFIYKFDAFLSKSQQ